MTLAELKKLLVQLTQTYFAGATVTYAKQSFVAKPGSPLVTLTTGSVNRSRNPPVKIIEGTPVAFYPASVPVQIDLFTHGRQEEVAPGFTPIAENTAEDDMFILAFEVIRTNYNGFFKKLGDRFGKVAEWAERTMAQARSATATSTSAVSQSLS